MTTAKTTTNTTASPSPAAALFRIALTEYQRAEAEFNRLDAEHSAANAALKAELEEPDPAFARYKIEQRSPSEAVDRLGCIRRAEMGILVKDYVGRGDLTADEYAEVTRKATILVDAYEDYLQRREEAEARILGDVEERWEASLDKLCSARNALWRTPAPDADAMLLKLDLLSAYMIDGRDDFHAEVTAIRDDARRLFGKAA
jgi:hypothetical protein